MKFGIQIVSRRHEVIVAALFSLFSTGGWSAAANDVDLLDLGLEELLDIQVTSVSKRSESLDKVPSAVFVISSDDIRRSGVNTLPDVLRMVPGVQVAQIDSNKWAITARSFNGRFANRLLVMVDGRTVYSPTFSGVYWDALDLRLEDIERVEVVRGPGGSVWGANAVNGVINIISKHAADTQGTEVVVGGGNVEKAFFNARVGGKLTEDGYARVSVNAQSHGESELISGGKNNDGWETYRVSGRFDKYLDNSNTLSATANYGEGDIDQEFYYPTVVPPFEGFNDDGADYSLWNGLVRWDHTVSSRSAWSLQLYYDHFDRSDLNENRDTYDIDFTHQFQFGEQHDIVWGAGYRLLRNELGPTVSTYVEHDIRQNELFSFFAQDQWSPVEELAITVGAKIEHNDYTGYELQPSAKLRWTVADDTQFWASVAKAVRTPPASETEVDFLSYAFPPSCSSPPQPSCPIGTTLPLIVAAEAAAEPDSEELIAYEMGIRQSLSNNLNIDLALFYNDYSKIRSFYYNDPVFRFAPIPSLYIGTDYNYSNDAQTHGAELALNWLASSDLSFDLAYSYIVTKVNWLNPQDIFQNAPAPRHQFSLQTHYRFTQDVSANFWLRYVHETTGTYTESIVELDPYWTADLNIAWQLSPSIELRLVGQNLFDDTHPEFIQEFLIQPAEVRRSIFGKLNVRF